MESVGGGVVCGGNTSDSTYGCKHSSTLCTDHHSAYRTRVQPPSSVHMSSQLCDCELCVVGAGKCERGKKEKRSGVSEMKKNNTFVLTLLAGLRRIQLQETLECHAAHARQFCGWVSRS